MAATITMTAAAAANKAAARRAHRKRELINQSLIKFRLTHSPVTNRIVALSFQQSTTGCTVHGSIRYQRDEQYYLLQHALLHRFMGSQLKVIV